MRIAGQLGVWKDKATAAAANAEIARFEGVYTVSAEDGVDHGSGYLSLIVGKNGDVKASGKLADGTSASATKLGFTYKETSLNE